MTENHLPAAIQNFIEATNRGDSDAFVAAFTQDAYLNDWGREFHGHQGVRAWNRTAGDATADVAVIAIAAAIGFRDR